jgi:hypothetical protein
MIELIVKHYEKGQRSLMKLRAGEEDFHQRSGFDSFPEKAMPCF